MNAQKCRCAFCMKPPFLTTLSGVNQPWMYYIKWFNRLFVKVYLHHYIVHVHPQKKPSSISNFAVISRPTVIKNVSIYHLLFLWVLVSIQIEAAKGFLSVIRSYLDSLCCNIRSHTITNVQSNDDKVCILFPAEKQVRCFDFCLLLLPLWK